MKKKIVIPLLILIIIICVLSIVIITRPSNNPSNPNPEVTETAQEKSLRLVKELVNDNSASYLDETEMIGNPNYYVIKATIGEEIKVFYIEKTSFEITEVIRESGSAFIEGD